MIRRLFVSAATLVLLTSAGAAWTFDQDLAESYARLFEPVAGAKAGKAIHFMPVPVFLDKLKTGAQIVTLDVRTPAEASVFTSALPGNLTIPISELFTPENLARIPVDRDVVVLCQSGPMATAAATALRHVGFENAHILKGGYKALSAYLTAKTANTPPKAGQTQ